MCYNGGAKENTNVNVRSFLTGGAKENTNVNVRNPYGLIELLFKRIFNRDVVSTFPPQEGNHEDCI